MQNKILKVALLLVATYVAPAKVLAKAVDAKIDELNKRYDLVVPKLGNWYEVEQKGLCGLVDKDLREVIPPTFAKLTMLNNHLLQVCDKNGKFSILRTNGTPVQLPDFEQVYVDKNGWVGIRQAERWGCLSPTAHRVLAPKYNNLISFEQGGSMARVELDGLWGFVDTSFAEIVTPQYRFVQPFSEGLATVNKDGRMGAINQSGKVVIPIEYDEISECKYGVMRVRSVRKYGLLSPENKLIVPIDYDKIHPFNEGVAAVESNKGCGFIDATGQIVIPLNYDNTKEMTDGCAVIARNGRWGLLSNTGKELLPVIYQKMLAAQNGLVRVRKDAFWGRFDKNGNTNVRFRYQFIDIMVAGFAQVQLNGKFGYVNERGDEICAPIYDKVEHFHNGLGLVFKAEKCGLIDPKGKEVLPCDFDVITILDGENGFCIAEKGARRIIYDRYGKCVSGCVGSSELVKNKKEGFTEE